MNKKDGITRRDVLRGRVLSALLTGALPDNKADVPPSGDGPSPRYPANADDLAPAASQSARFRRTIPVIRPPGAVDEPTFLDACTRCNACVEACPHDAIVHAPARLREAAGTPMIDPSRQPCMMCDDLPCVAACEPGVLTTLVPPIMATARIVEETCLAHQRSFCTVCSERCPVEGAIELDGGRPTIVEDRCTGCGVCHHVCPAPENAVLVMPVLTRPPAPSDPAG